VGDPEDKIQVPSGGINANIIEQDGVIWLRIKKLSAYSEGVCELLFSIKCVELKRVTVFVIYS
jgi:hypothetical protein